MAKESFAFKQITYVDRHNTEKMRRKNVFFYISGNDSAFWTSWLIDSVEFLTCYFWHAFTLLMLCWSFTLQHGRFNIEQITRQLNSLLIFFIVHLTRAPSVSDSRVWIRHFNWSCGSEYTVHDHMKIRFECILSALWLGVFTILCNFADFYRLCQYLYSSNARLLNGPVVWLFL